MKRRIEINASRMGPVRMQENIRTAGEAMGLSSEALEDLAWLAHYLAAARSIVCDARKRGVKIAFHADVTIGED
jgi:hypothetical protein